jgi:hypothetical protein
MATAPHIGWIDQASNLPALQVHEVACIRRLARKLLELVGMSRIETHDKGSKVPGMDAEMILRGSSIDSPEGDSHDCHLYAE